MPRALSPVVMEEATDWSGQIISRQMSRYLFPGCVVRVVIRNPEGRAEAIYFEITKVKDGTFWGIAQETLRWEDWVGIPDGTQMTFGREHINEIPLSWQPKRFQKAVGPLASRMKDVGYAITGLRGAGL